MGKSDIDVADLSARVIESELKSRVTGAVDVAVLDSVGSTNTWLKDALLPNGLPVNSVSVCATEHQTAGRGRRGKTWHTPKYGVTFSTAITVAHPARELSGLSLLCGVAVCDVLRGLGVASAMVKWPNDIWVEHSKLAGILVEIATSGNHESTVIIGIGLNYQRGSEAEKIDQFSTDMFELLGESLPDRSILIAAIAGEVWQACLGQIPETVEHLSAKWSEYDALAGKLVQIETGQQFRYGRCDGLDSLGQLRVITETGPILVSSGNVSVRPA